MIIVANTEVEALSAATAQMGSAARIEFVPRPFAKRWNNELDSRTLTSRSRKAEKGA
jgi:hypothetical protein